MLTETRTSWIAALDRMESNLAAALARTDAPDPLPPAPAPTGNPLAALDAHLDRLHERLAQAEAAAADTDALLASAAADLRHWLESLAAVRQRVTDSASRR